jgi:hypothetical protein
VLTEPKHHAAERFQFTFLAALTESGAVATTLAATVNAS